MLAGCCNPECEVLFDYRQGRLMRFSRTLPGETSENQRVIQHFWLCGKCAGQYVFELESGISVKLKARHQDSSEETLSYFVSAA